MATCSIGGPSPWRDWCPLCGERFEGDSPGKLAQKILDHTKEKDGQKSRCEQNFRPFDVALADDHY